jgi:hypothetical protein
MNRKRETEIQQRHEQEQQKPKPQPLANSHWQLSKETIEHLLGAKLKENHTSTTHPHEPSSSALGRKSFKRFNPLIEDVSRIGDAGRQMSYIVFVYNISFCGFFFK